LAGEQLGLKTIYLEAGSGAQNSVSKEIIKAVKKQINIPLIVGGGIRSIEQIEKRFCWRRCCRHWNGNRK
jgi:heptaprenylglyceryl phosphate synthase